MGFKCGIVGLPNIGKSTLFNALTQTMMAEAANYPFCTIEPNIGRVSVPDERLLTLAKIAGSAKIIPVQLEFVDIAGLVRGASKGEGLGNQFLSHIREVDAILHLTRCFINKDVTHVENSIDPLRDEEIITTELILADMESLEKRLPNLEKKAKSDPEAKAQVETIKEVSKLLEAGKPAREYGTTPEKMLALKALQLITSKPVMYVCNVEEESAATGNELSDKVKAAKGDAVIISAAIESEVASLGDENEKKEFLESLGLKETGLTSVIRAGYKLLNLITFFTIGPKEAHAWTVRGGGTAPEAAGEIHTDFMKGFIRAETIAATDYIKYNGEQGAKEAGKLRLEGKEYIVKDGDIFHFRFNV